MPDLSAGYLSPLPHSRPAGVVRRTLPAGSDLWRIDTQPPSTWDWAGFPAPRYRFDPTSGAFRVRYAGRNPVGAARERYRDSGMFIPADHQGHHLVHLVANRPLRVFDLRTERNLDVLGVDDQVSTGHHPRVWDTCHLLSDAVRSWWDDLDAIVYRSRTSPTTSLNVAFFATDGLEAQSWPLADRPDVMSDLVLNHAFTVDWDILP